MESPWGRKESDTTEWLSLCGDKGHACPQGVSTLSAEGDIKQMGGAHKTMWSILSQEKPLNLPTCQTCTHKTVHDDLLLKGGMEKPHGGPGSCGGFFETTELKGGSPGSATNEQVASVLRFHLPSLRLWHFTYLRDHCEEVKETLHM